MDSDLDMISGRDGCCCHAPILAGSVPKKVEMKINPNGSQENFLSWARRKVPYAFISEEELIDEWYMILNRAPLIWWC